jgi:GT2 family glycosyltransferase
MGMEADNPPTIGVVIATYNRAHLLQQCVENVLVRTSPATRQIVIWDNGSTDDTPRYLRSLGDPRIKVIRHPENIAQNAFARACAMTSTDYLVTLADDIIGAPEHWDSRLLGAFRRLPEVGYLGTDLEDDEHDEAAHLRYRVRPHMYTSVEINGVRLLRGPTGGWCAMTSRDIYDRVGGFRQDKKRLVWAEDEAYIADIEKIGYSAAIFADLKVRHAGGLYYQLPSPGRIELMEEYLRLVRRKNAVKRVLLRVPFLAPLNERYGWFATPEAWKWYEDFLDDRVRTYRAALSAAGRGTSQRPVEG